jgi:hypothetical protein
MYIPGSSSGTARQLKTLIHLTCIQGDFTEQGKSLDLSEENHQGRYRNGGAFCESLNKNNKKNKDNPIPGVGSGEWARSRRTRKTLSTDQFRVEKMIPRGTKSAAWDGDQAFSVGRAMAFRRDLVIVTQQNRQRLARLFPSAL